MEDRGRGRGVCVITKCVSKARLRVEDRGRVEGGVITKCWSKARSRVEDRGRGRGGGLRVVSWGGRDGRWDE